VTIRSGTFFDGLDAPGNAAQNDPVAHDFDTRAAAAKLTGTAGSILERKGRVVHSIGPGESVYAAVAKLNEARVGALLVMEGSQLLGVVSERDYTREVILQGRSSEDTRVDEIMSTPVVSVELSTPLGECLRLVTERRVRHLPVMEAGRVVGVISIGDLVRTIVLQQGETIEQLSTLITDRYPT
jgi:CBS domain-containing protein